MSLLLALLALLFGGFGVTAGPAELTPSRELPRRTYTYSSPPTPQPAPPQWRGPARGSFLPHFA